MRREQRKSSRDIYEKFENLISYAREKNEYFPVIVEGIRDEKALKEMGFEGKIIKINVGENLVDFSDDLSKKYNRVIILLDWDRKGDYLTRKLQSFLEANGVVCDLEIRRKLKSLLGSYITSIEEFSSFGLLHF